MNNNQKNKRLLTKREEQVIRLCHHDHKGFTTKQTAAALKISTHRVNEILRQVQKKSPQLFPILTQLEAKCYHYYQTEGWPVKEIADNILEIPTTSVYKALQRARKKGMYFKNGSNKILQYDPSLDNQVKEKF